MWAAPAGQLLLGSSGTDVPTPPLPLTGQQTGIARGLEAVAPRADGRQLATPRSFRVGELHRKRAPHRVARRVTGRHRRRQAVHLRARGQQQVGRARQDCRHTTALALVRQYETIAHADVPPANRGKNHQLAKRSSDGGWRAFLAIRAAKAA